MVMSERGEQMRKQGVDPNEDGRKLVFFGGNIELYSDGSTFVFPTRTRFN